MDQRKKIFDRAISVSALNTTVAKIFKSRFLWITCLLGNYRKQTVLRSFYFVERFPKTVVTRWLVVASWVCINKKTVDLESWLTVAISDSLASVLLLSEVSIDALQTLYQMRASLVDIWMAIFDTILAVVLFQLSICSDRNCQIAPPKNIS